MFTQKVHRLTETLASGLLLAFVERRPLFIVLVGAQRPRPTYIRIGIIAAGVLLLNC